MSAGASGCPSWCQGHAPGELAAHLSACPPVPLGHGAIIGIATAYACQAQDDPVGSAVEVAVLLPVGQQKACLRVTDPSTALSLSYLLRLLADATPAQHRELAGLVTAAAAIMLSHDAGPERSDA